MIGFRGALRYTRDAEAARARARGARPGLGRRPPQPPRDAAVRAHGARARRAATSSSPRAACSTGRGFELWVMAEVPSVLFNLERYAALGIAGISIGSNDLTQLMLGADRDSELLAETFDERDPAVTDYLRAAHPARPRARAADVDLRPGAVGAPRVRRAPRPRRASTRSRSTRRRRPHAAAGGGGGAAAAARGRPGRRLRVATTDAADRRAALLGLFENLSRFHREHEKFYGEAPLQEAAALVRTSRSLKALAERWAAGPAAGAGPGEPVRGRARPQRRAGDRGERDPLPGVRRGAGRARPHPAGARGGRGGRRAGRNRLADAMQAAWEVAAELLRFPELADLLGERHAIIAADWQSATTLQLLARQLRRAVAILDRVDFTAAGPRADLAGDRSTPTYVFSAAELLDQAADLTLRSATLVRGNERRWRVFHDRVAGLGPPA